MDRRLKKISELVEEGIGCVDVGTDHAYVPILLRKSGYKGNIIATDINKEPLNNARKNASGFDNIEFLLTDGLNGVDNSKIDTVIIAGMGGDLICDILDRAEWTMNDKFHLILQPMTKPEVLRYWLINNGYSILKEVFIDGYVIISVRFLDQNTCYNDYELFLGKTPSEEYFLKQYGHLKKVKNSEFFSNIVKELENDYSKRDF